MSAPNRNDKAEFYRSIDELVQPHKPNLFGLGTHPTTYEDYEDFRGREAIFLYGSGVFVRRQGVLFGVTATHVLIGSKYAADKIASVMVTSFGPCRFERVPVRPIKGHDLAIFVASEVIPPEYERMIQGETTFYNRDALESIKLGVCVGYPAERNEIASGENFNPHSLTLTRTTRQFSTSSIENPINFDFPTRATPTGFEQRRWWERKTDLMPHPSGMSGGPVFNIADDLEKAELFGVISLGVSYLGGSPHTLTASPIHPAIDCIDNLLK